MERERQKSEFAQVPIKCTYYNNLGKHCWIDGDYEENATDCCVLDEGAYCKMYKTSMEGK